MDISETLIPNSDQLDAEDLAASGPRTFTIERVTKGNAEQPISVHFSDFPRPWRPGRNMRRVLAHCWGKDSAVWATRQVELYCDPDVHFGKEKVGGTRISRLSHINGPIEAPIIVGRGKRGKWKVNPLATAAPTPTQPPSPTATLLAEIKTAAEAASVDLATIAADWAESHDGQDIRQATDLGALELVRDDLRGRA